jgi:signal transduction histidine kinase
VKNFSLTARLIAVVVACQLLLTAGLTVVAVVYARAELLAAFDATLQGRATGVLALVRYTESTPPGLLFDRSLLPPPPDKTQQDLFEVRGPNGELVAQSGVPGSISESLAQARGAFANFTLQSRPYRAVALRDVPVLDDEESVKVPSRVTVVYASSLAGMNGQLTRLAIYVAGTSLLLLLAASVMAAWGVRRGLRPLRDLATQAGSISVHNWEFHSPSDQEMASELVPLAGAIATVLDRLQESFRQQRDFTSDAAHELKTSVAILKSTLQSLHQKPRTEQEYREGLEDSLQDCDRLEDLLERMLRLARIEEWAGGATRREVGTAELTSTCEAAIARIERMAKARNVELKLVDSVSAHLLADPKDLELIWVNLLENAVQYSPAGATVVMRTQRLGANAVLVCVDDCGSGISPAELPHIFGRFRRGDPSRARSTGGFGLGLAICKALVEAYGGHIEAANRDGQGAEMRVQLPTEPEMLEYPSS